MPVNYKEIAFEQAIEAFLLTEEGGYDSVHSKTFDKESALFPTILLPFIQETQPKAWKAIESFHGKDTERFILKELCLAIDHQGLLDVIRHGFKCFGKRLRVAWFRSPHGMNLKLRSCINEISLPSPGSLCTARLIANPLM